jgi:hypothetical protein
LRPIIVMMAPDLCRFGREFAQVARNLRSSQAIVMMIAA